MIAYLTAMRPRAVELETASAGPGAPPRGLLAFYWHFVRQTKRWYALMFATSLAVAPA